jgi:hypothetical protein
MRLSFFVATIGAIVLLPLEFKLLSALLLLVRYIVMGVANSKIATRVGEKGIAAWDTIFDFFEPWVRFVIRATQRERISVWR